jgi:iron(III) transport system substrate-binding protein
VVKLVGAGEAWIGMTDSDDIAAGQRNGYPIAAAAIPQEFNDEYLRIPNTVALVKGARHPEAAQTFMAFVESPQTLNQLVGDHALESATGGSSLSSSRPFAETREVLKTIFVRE